MTRVDVKRAEFRLPSGGYGCTRPLAGFGCFCILLGLLAISHWDNVPIVARVGAIVLVVFGGICVLPMLGLWTLRLWVDRFAKKLFHRINHINEVETKRNHALYGGDIEYRPATDADLQDGEREDYDRASAELVGVGCQHLGDVVNVKSHSANIRPTVMRMIAGPNGVSWIALHRETKDMPEAAQDNAALTIELASEFIDGAFCCTSNSPGVSPRDLPPQLRMETFAADMPAAELVRQHERHAEMLTSSEILIFTTLADVLASEQRKYALTAGFRAMIGLSDPA